MNVEASTSLPQLSFESQALTAAGICRERRGPSARSIDHTDHGPQSADCL